MDIDGILIDCVDTNLHLWAAAIGLQLIAYGNLTKVLRTLRRRHLITKDQAAAIVRGAV